MESMQSSRLSVHRQSFLGDGGFIASDQNESFVQNEAADVVQHVSSSNSSLVQNQAMDPRNNISFGPDPFGHRTFSGNVSRNPSTFASNQSSMSPPSEVSNPYVDSGLMQNMSQFSPFQNKRFVEKHGAHSGIVSDGPKSANTTWQFNTSNVSGITPNMTNLGNLTGLTGDEPEEESTASDTDMIDREQLENQTKPTKPALSRKESVTAEQIFNESAILEQEASMLQHDEVRREAPSKVSAVRSAQISRSFKRYRRKSLVPTMDAMDDHLEDEQPEHEEEQREMTEPAADTKKVSVCEAHRLKAKAVAGFEYECLACECYLTESQRVQYRQFVRLADAAEAKEDWLAALHNLMEALTICNSDMTLHTRCQVIGNEHMQF